MSCTQGAIIGSRTESASASATSSAVTTQIAGCESTCVARGVRLGGWAVGRVGVRVRVSGAWVGAPGAWCMGGRVCGCVGAWAGERHLAHGVWVCGCVGAWAGERHLAHGVWVCGGWAGERHARRAGDRLVRGKRGCARGSPRQRSHRSTPGLKQTASILSRLPSCRVCHPVASAGTPPKRAKRPPSCICRPRRAHARALPPRVARRLRGPRARGCAESGATARG